MKTRQRAFFGGSATASAALIAILLAPTADATGSEGGCVSAGGTTTHCRTGGSTQIYTAPNPSLGNNAGIYGPFFHQNRGLGGAAVIVGGSAAAAKKRGR